MGSAPGPRLQIEKEWSKITIIVSKKIGLVDSGNPPATTELLKKIQANHPEIYRILNEYLEAYKNYISYLKEVREETVSHYFELEDQMNEKKDGLFIHLDNHR